MSDIKNLYNFQKRYLFSLLENIPVDREYELQLDGFNSAGWIMGHLCVEAVDALTKLGIEPAADPSWHSYFSYDADQLNSVEGLPTLAESKAEFERLYSLLMEAYERLSPEAAARPPDSLLLAEILANKSTWLAHHLTTHVSVHAGNLVVWKKLLKLEIGGY